MKQHRTSARLIVANNVHKYRKIKGYTKSGLSKKLGFYKSYISKLELGKVNPRVCIIEKIAQILEIPFIKLFEK